MILTPDTSGNTLYKIKAYTENTITINEEIYSISLVLSTKKIIPHWQANPTQLTIEDFYFLKELRPRIFLLGTGNTLTFPSNIIFQLFSDYHMGLECMSTAAACRTFNVLASEGREVAAGLIIN